MTKRIESVVTGASPKAKRSRTPKLSTLNSLHTMQDADEDTLSRSDRLIELIDHCTAAMDVADALGERFLSYLLAMTVQEARTAMRRTQTRRRLPN